MARAMVRELHDAKAMAIGSGPWPARLLVCFLCRCFDDPKQSPFTCTKQSDTDKNSFKLTGRSHLFNTYFSTTVAVQAEFGVR